jgi:competence ComEA-like helix-hairpin-helix protein
MMKNIKVKPIGILMLAMAFWGMTAWAGQTPSKDSGKTQSPAAAKTPILKGKTVNINKATEAEMVKNIPLITPELAKKIVKYRKDNGDFQSLDELLQIDGINRELIRKIKPFLLLEGLGGKDCTC